MGFTTSQPSKNVMGFRIVNYSAKAVFNVFFLSVIVAGLAMVVADNHIHFSLLSKLIIWSVFSLTIFLIAMRYRNGCVRQEIDEGLHDPVWGKHIKRQRQRERDNLNESNWITRPLFRFACFIGIHKKQK